MRYDPVYNVWVSVSEKRNMRPQDFARRESAPMLETEKFRTDPKCPFCEGNERETPLERDAIPKIPREDWEAMPFEEKTLDNYRRPNAPGWLVRAVPNRYPFVEPDSEMTLQHIGPYYSMPNVGIQEVIVDVPYHATRLGQLDAEEFQYLIHFYHRRIHQLRKSCRWRYAHLFKNQGSEAGASLAHIHTQLVGLPFVPRSVEYEGNFLKKYQAENGHCYHCMVMEYEMRERWRYVAQTEYFNAFCPFASRFVGEVHILPRRHVPCFVQSTREELDDLAVLFRQIIQRLEVVLPTPDYNVVLRNSPWSNGRGDLVPDESFHWRLEIQPRATKLAGYELGTGNFINPVSPERAAMIFSLSGGNLIMVNG